MIAGHQDLSAVQPGKQLQVLLAAQEHIPGVDHGVTGPDALVPRGDHVLVMGRHVGLPVRQGEAAQPGQEPVPQVGVRGVVRGHDGILS